MKKAEARKLVEGVTVIPRSHPSGEPLWTVPVPNGSVDVHAANEAEAREKAADFLVVIGDD